MESEFIWLDGELVPFRDANVHILSPTLHYGAGAFESVRCFDTERGAAIFRLPDHLDRFLNSIHILGFDRIQFDIEALRRAVHRTVHANGFTSCYIRMLMYLDGPMGLDLDLTEPRIGIAAWKWHNLPGTRIPEAGVRMMISSFATLHTRALMTQARITGQYSGSTMAKTFALRSGFDEAALLDGDGHVVAGTSEDLFLIKNGELFVTPDNKVLAGVVRDTLIQLARDANYSVKMTPLTRDLLYVADEVFVCGTANGIVTVRNIDNRTIGDGRMGTITRTLRQLYAETVQGKSPRSRMWLDYVMGEPLY